LPPDTVWVYVAGVVLSSAMTRADETKLGIICQDQPVTDTSPGFNINVQCPAGQVVVTGGYQCTESADGDLLESDVEENTFAFTTPTNKPTTPTGWQTIGFAENIDTTPDAGSVECASVAPRGLARTNTHSTIARRKQEIDSAAIRSVGGRGIRAVPARITNLATAVDKEPLPLICRGHTDRFNFR
jgi:hypothetical protein